MRALVLAVATGVIVALAAPAYAEPVDVPALIKLIDSQPSDMERPVWKEKRREAARKLVQSKDKRAVPVLIKLADAETFDIIGEVAIEGLGTLADPSAIPTLQKIVGDPSRDRGQRDLARKALGKLGAGEAPVKPTGGGATGGGKTGGTTGGGTTGGGTTGGGTTGGGTTGGGTTGGGTTGGTGLETAGAGSGSDTDGGNGSADTGSSVLSGGTPTGGSLIGTHTAPDAPTLPVLEDDTLAAYERLTFAGGTANLDYDTARKRSDFSADVAGLYQRRIERETMAWGVDIGAHVLAGLVNPDGRAQSKGAQLSLDGDGEVRFYAGSIYGVGKAATVAQLDYITYTDNNNANQDFKASTFSADALIALGGGYGRVLDVGAAIRVRRLARALDAARALGKPIDAATSRKLQLTWWALRGERTSYRVLIATVAVLREAGILLSEPDAGLTYDILNVLRDTQLFVRPSGFDAQLAVGEGYLKRPTDPTNVETGRFEQLLALAGYGSQLDDDKLELSGSGFARLRLFAAMMDPSPWAVGANARMRRFTYGEHGDPLGALDLTGNITVSSDDLMNSKKAMRIAAELGFTYLLNQASGLRLAAQLAEDGGKLFLGAQLQATYGFLDGTFAR